MQMILGVTRMQDFCQAITNKQMEIGFLKRELFNFLQ